jgi:hypothetical protein
MALLRLYKTEPEELYFFFLAKAYFALLILFFEGTCPWIAHFAPLRLLYIPKRA